MRVLLAPMEGVVDHHLRYLLTRLGGIDSCVTEFIRVTEQTLPRKVFLRYSPELLKKSPELLNNCPDLTNHSLKLLNNSSELTINGRDQTNEGPTRVLDNAAPQALVRSTSESMQASRNLAHLSKEVQTLAALPSAGGALCPTKIQLLGSNPKTLAENAYKAARMGAPGIDLNFGCPAKTVNRHRGGACLLQEPSTIFDIVSTVRKYVPDNVPVTAKIRLGFEDRSSYLDNAKAIFDAGADELVVHARSKSDGYKPPAYWECIAEIHDRVSTRVVANGDIWNLEDYKRCRSISACKDVMLGRGLLSRPDLARQIKAYLNNEEYKARTWSQLAPILLEFLDITSAAYAAKYCGNRVKQWLFYLCRSYPEAKLLFDAIKRERQYDSIRAAILNSISLETPLAERDALKLSRN